MLAPMGMPPFSQVELEISEGILLNPELVGKQQSKSKVQNQMRGHIMDFWVEDE